MIVARFTSIPQSLPIKLAHLTQCSTRRPDHRSCVVTAAAAKKKSGGGGGKGANKKGPGLLVPKQITPYTSTQVIIQNLLLIESHFRKTGRPIFEEEIEISDAAKALWHAPFAVLAHNNDPDPTFVYANKAALDLFEAEWDQIIGTPSMQSAEDITDIQEDRSNALRRVAEQGYMDDYQGNRISFKGTKFRITKATLFNVETPAGDERVGQAAIIRSWEYEDGRKGGEVEATEGNDGTVPANAGAITATPEELAAAEGAVAEQARIVRDLKEGQGLGNNAPEVEAAVKLLLEKKVVLAQLKGDLE